MNRRWLRNLHKWIGIVSCLFMLLVSSTAIALNHSDLWKPLFLHASEQNRFDLNQAKYLVADPHQASHLLASNDKALYQSHDGGSSWSELKLFVPAEKITGIAFHPTKSQYFWIALREVGIYWTDDGGELWEEMFDLPFNPVEGEYIDQLSVAQGPTLKVKTEMALYSYSPNAKWSKHSLVKGNSQQTLSMHDLIWQLHTGRFFGSWGVWLYDLISICLILLSISGLLLAKRPRKKELT